MQRSLAAAIVASLVAPLGMGLLVVAAIFGQHAMAFRGTCGPYPTDIPAYPCGFGEYVENFFGGFSGIGLFMIAVGTVVVTALAVGALWVVAAAASWVGRALRRGDVA